MVFEANKRRSTSCILKSLTAFKYYIENMKYYNAPHGIESKMYFL